MNATGVVEPIVALDVPGRTEAERLVAALGPACTFVKVGLELFTRAGPDTVRWLRGEGRRVFLDLKLHDIPTTVAGAVAAARDLDVDLLTLHASGGEPMMRAAQAEAGDVRLLGVTVLTSLDADGLGAAWGREAGLEVESEVVRLARAAVGAGLAGAVASVAEAAALRRALGPNALVVTPGIRFAGEATHDQARTATPEQAARAGASHIVVGRAVTAAADPSAALARVCRELLEVTP